MGREKKFSSNNKSKINSKKAVENDTSTSSSDGGTRMDAQSESGILLLAEEMQLLRSTLGNFIEKLGENVGPSVKTVVAPANVERNIDDSRVQWLSREEAARLANVKPKTISNWKLRGWITTREAGKFRYNKKSIERFLLTGNPQGRRSC